MRPGCKEQPLSSLMLSSEADFVPRARNWILDRVPSLDWLVPALFVVFLIDWLTYTAGYAATDDPGTYVWQAWAVLEGKGLAHYTYWYDHPPVGWIQIAIYAFFTGGFVRSEIGVLMGSEFMVFMQLASCMLIFAFMRRLKFGRPIATLAVLLFALSPIAIQYQKVVFLDNISVTWTLAAMVLALSPRRSLSAAMGVGFCLAMACLTKITSGAFVIPVFYLMWQNYPKGYRVWAYTQAMGTMVGMGMFYFGYAFIKGEFFPGPGHVSLLDSLVWQLTRTIGFDAIGLWTSFDKFLLYATAAALPVALIVRRLRPVALGFILLAGMVLRGGYIPAPFVINMLPFAALTVAGVVGVVWPHREVVRGKVRGWANGTAVRFVRMALALALVGGFGYVATPKWTESIEIASSRAELTYYRQTLDYIVKNVPKDAVIAVDDNLWGDLVRKGFINVVWFYKLDLDPAVQEQYLKNGYKSVDYVALKQIYYEIAKDNAVDPVVIQAKNNGNLVAQFGNLDPQRGTVVDPYDVIKVTK